MLEDFNPQLISHAAIRLKKYIFSLLASWDVPNFLINIFYIYLNIVLKTVHKKYEVIVGHVLT